MPRIQETDTDAQSRKRQQHISIRHHRRPSHLGTEGRARQNTRGSDGSSAWRTSDAGHEAYPYVVCRSSRQHLQSANGIRSTIWIHNRTRSAPTDADGTRNEPSCGASRSGIHTASGSNQHQQHRGDRASRPRPGGHRPTHAASPHRPGSHSLEIQHSQREPSPKSSQPCPVELR